MDITELRDRIDGIDDKLAALIRERMDISKQVGKYKEQKNLPALDEMREREVLKRVTGAVGDEYAEYAKVLYRTLLDLSKSAQIKKRDNPFHMVKRASFPKKAVVACQGVMGSHAEEAASRLFSLPDIMYMSEFDGVFQAVESGMCEYGVLPIENSSAGSVIEVYDLMRKYKTYIVRSVKQRIENVLLVRPGVALSDIREVFSHEQAIRQCAGFFAEHPDIKATTMRNTALAAEFVAGSERGDVAAIASANCAGVYGLSVLPVRAQLSDFNYTRFILISKTPELYPGSNKISLMLALPHRPGTLYSLMARFAALGLNLTKLESRPIIGKDFEFLFYFDLEASIETEEVASLLAELNEQIGDFTFLGNYTEVF